MLVMVRNHRHFLLGPVRVSTLEQHDVISTTAPKSHKDKET